MSRWWEAWVGDGVKRCPAPGWQWDWHVVRRTPYTPRQHEALRLAAEGHSTSEIARLMGVSYERVRQLLHGGRIPGPRPPGRNLDRWDEWEAERKRKQAQVTP